MVRHSEAPIDPQFLDRWSPRALSSEPLTDEQVRSLFEAARWAPSSGNEQPWLFLYAVKEEDLRRFRPILVEGNRVWADRAPLLCFVFSRRTLRRSGKPSPTYAFDAGAAWMSLALEARKLGLFAHGMAGFHKDLAYKELGVPEEEYEVLAAIAVGRYGDPATLPEALREREQPSGRKPLSEVAVEGPLRR